MSYGNPVGMPSSPGTQIDQPGYRSFLERTDANQKVIGLPKGSVSNLVSFGTPFQSGSGTITGNVFYGTGSTPARRFVVLHDTYTRSYVSSTFSRASDGYFEFRNLPKDRTYYVIAFDTDPPFDRTAEDIVKRSEAWDNLTPV